MGKSVAVIRGKRCKLKRRGKRDRFTRQEKEGKAESKSSTESRYSLGSRKEFVSNIVERQFPCVSRVNTYCKRFCSCTIFSMMCVEQMVLGDLRYCLPTEQSTNIMLCRKIKMRPSSGEEIVHVCYQPPHDEGFPEDGISQLGLKPTVCTAPP